MGRVANQQSVKISKKINKNDKNILYLEISQDDLFNASQNLNGNAFKLYFYLAKNQNGYIDNFSSAFFAEKMGVPSDPRTIKRAKDELIEKGFLIEESAGNYIFKAEGRRNEKD